MFFLIQYFTQTEFKIHFLGEDPPSLLVFENENIQEYVHIVIFVKSQYFCNIRQIMKNVSFFSPWPVLDQLFTLNAPSISIDMRSESNGISDRLNSSILCSVPYTPDSWNIHTFNKIKVRDSRKLFYNTSNRRFSCRFWLIMI